ncbi:MAG: hypothetical protein FJ267_18220, partial [Planctomycetes bacterium]|nr:hypothetical protein [Planctomycetota bacterium]
MVRLISSYCLFIVVVVSNLYADETAKDLYSDQIKPLLARTCVQCHGPSKQQSGLRLDFAKGITEGGDSGSAIVVGDSSKSLLIHAITGTEGASKMPPEGEGFTVEQINMIRKWIDEGAKSPTDEVIPSSQIKTSDHWSFRQIVRHVPPAISSESITSDVIRSPIDAFVVDRL